MTIPMHQNRFTLGAQIVQALVDNGFVGDDKWSNVVLVGACACAPSLERARTDQIRRDTGTATLPLDHSRQRHLRMPLAVAANGMWQERLKIRPTQRTSTTGKRT